MSDDDDVGGNTTTYNNNIIIVVIHIVIMFIVIPIIIIIINIVIIIIITIIPVIALKILLNRLQSYIIVVGGVELQRKYEFVFRCFHSPWFLSPAYVYVHTHIHIDTSDSLCSLKARFINNSFKFIQH